MPATAGEHHCRRFPRFIYLKLHFLIALYTTTAVPGHLISFDAPALVFWRFPAGRGGRGRSGGGAHSEHCVSNSGTLLPLIGIGGIMSLHWICFFGAVKLANISICLAGMATTSFFTAFTEPPLERRRVRPLEVLLGLLMVAGIPLVAGFERVHLAGLLIALAGALVAAIFPVMNRRLVMKEKMDPFMMVVWEMAGASAICIRLSSREPPPLSLQTSPIR